MHVSELWAYPVKSLAGTALQLAELTAAGIRGDRRVEVRDAADRLVTARTRPALLGLRATFAGDGAALVDGAPWDGPGAAAAVRAAAGDGVRLAACAPGAGFDDTPLLLATDGSIRFLGVDGRRLRPNLVVSGVDGLDERGWPGRRLRVGDALVVVEKLCRRCVMTTFDPDTLEQDPGVLERINAVLGGRTALNCGVARGGTVAVGDAVELIRSH